MIQGNLPKVKVPEKCQSCHWRTYPPCPENARRKERQGNMTICFVSSPYRAKSKGQVSANIRHAKRLSRKLAEEGYVVISPLCNFSFVKGCISEGDILKACLALVARSDMVCMGIGWGDSEGCLAEYFEAVDKGKVIIHECDGL